MRAMKQVNAMVLGSMAGAILLLGGCSTPGETRPGTGTWELFEPGGIAPESTTLYLGVTRLECSGGATGMVLDPEVRYEQDRILIRTNVEPLPEGAYDCQGNDSVPVTVKLAEPVGEKELVDAVCLDGDAVGTQPCVDGGIRWRP